MRLAYLEALDIGNLGRGGCGGLASPHQLDDAGRESNLAGFSLKLKWEKGANKKIWEPGGWL